MPADDTSGPRSGRREGRFKDGTAYMLAMAGAIMRRGWVEALARHDVTPTQFKIVMSLGTTDAVGLSELSALVGIDPRNCVPVVAALVERGIVSRETGSADRRRRVHRLTDLGRQLAGELDAANAAIEDALRRLLGPAAYAALHDSLLPILEEHDLLPILEEHDAER